MKFEVGQTVYLNTDLVDVCSEDQNGFIVLAAKPDSSKTIPVTRISDGEYQCLPIDFLVIDNTITGRFAKLLSGVIAFIPSQPIKAAKFGFNTPLTNNPIQHYVSDEVKFNLL